MTQRLLLELWEANPEFIAVPTEKFQAFHEPEFVKIVWTIRADPDGPERSILRTETRAIATDAESRRRFRLYWSLLSPGIVLIRRLLLPAAKREAESRGQSEPSRLKKLCTERRSNGS